MRCKSPVPIVLAGIGFCGLITAFVPKTNSPTNSPPQVTIITPGDNDRFQWNSLVHYKIRVSDEEDGYSEYNEIEANEVLLKVVYLPDASQLETYLSSDKDADLQHPGLSLIKTSGCFNCHSAKSKLIGPSFEQIAKRYPYNPSSIATLTQKVMDGSLGVWGDTPMPPHPDLTAEQAKQIIQWVLQYNSNSDVTYFSGLQGTFRTQEKPANDAGNGVYILTASYTDHGLNNNRQLRERGHHTIMLKSY